MPIYEYYCRPCDRTYEKLEKVGSPREIRCDSCDGLAQRVMSSFLTQNRAGPTKNPDLKKPSLAEQLRTRYELVEPLSKK